MATINGTSGSDFIQGSSAANMIFGLAGDDTLVGGAGNDTLDGGVGNDLMLGSMGNDVFLVDSAGDVCTELPGEGEDTVFASVSYQMVPNIEIGRLVGGGTNLSAAANGGNPVQLFVNPSVASTLLGGTGDDVLWGGFDGSTISGLGGRDSIHDQNAQTFMLGGLGDDQYFVGNIASVVSENAGEGTDTVWVTVNGYAASDNVEITRLGGTATTVSGANTDDQVVANPLFGSMVYGRNGNDTLSGSTFSDLLDGGAGNDSISADTGNDTLIGGAGNDTLNGGEGFDTAVFDANPGTLRIREAGGGALTVEGGPLGIDRLIGVEGIQTQDGMVTLQADLTGLFRASVAGDSYLLLGRAYVGPVAGLQRELFGSEANEVFGGTGGNDFINLFAGDDAANGGAGNDVIDGGLGSNFLVGGAGKDTFFSDGRGGGVTWTTITDWEAGEQLSVFGWRPGISRVLWLDQDGVGAFRGVTMHGDLNGDGVFDTSVTWSGLTRAALPTPLEFDGLLWFIG